MSVFTYHDGMLSYQHAYHAGNFADCHKHAILCALIDALHTKDTGITWYDFFAGRGAYRLNSIEALKTGEYQHGIAKLWANQNDWPEASQPYHQALQKANPNVLEHYPGSPLLIQSKIRLQDHLVCVEAHPQEHDALKLALGKDPQTTIHKRDAWEAFSALLPPKDPHKTPRSVAFLDPSYEVKSDYMTLAEKVTKVLARWPHGMYVIWYPLLSANLHDAMLHYLKTNVTRKTLHSQVIIQKPLEKGMFGSGMIMINPPWPFEEKLAEIGQWVVQALGQDKTAKHKLEWLVAEK